MQSIHKQKQYQLPYKLSGMSGKQPLLRALQWLLGMYCTLIQASAWCGLGFAVLFLAEKHVQTTCVMDILPCCFMTAQCTKEE